MKKNMSSPLELKEYFFPVIQAVADPDATENDRDFDLTVNVALARNAEEELYQVTLNIESIAGEGKKQQYQVSMSVVGIFTVSPSFPEPDKLLYINGASILYGAARELLITVTSRGPWPEITLPTFSFKDQYNQKVKKQLEKSATRNSEEEGKTKKKGE